MFSSVSKILKLLSNRQKIKLSMLIFLLILGMFLEIIGMGILVSFLEYISKPSKVIKIPFFFENITFHDKTTPLFFYLKLLFVLYFVKSVLLIYLIHRQNIFLLNFNANISTKLFDSFLNQPYSSYTKRNSSELYKILFTDTAYFNLYCTSIITIITEFALFSSIILGVILVEPMISSLSISTLMILSSLYYYFSKRKLKKWSIKRSGLEEKLSKVTLESLRGYKELIVFQKTEIFKEIFKKQKYFLNDLQAKFKTLNIAPRYIFELIAVIILCLIIVVNFILKIEISQIIPVLGLFVAAIFKVLPSLNKLISSSQNLKFYQSSIEIIIGELNQKDFFKNSSTDEISSISKIELNNIKFSYNNSEIILDGINLSLSKGETIGIIGESGKGKTTLIDCIMGLHQINEGEIILNSKYDIKGNIQNWRKKISYVPQNVFLLDSTLAENIAFGEDLKNIDFEKLNKVIGQSSLDEFVKNLSKGVLTVVGEEGVRLSGGQKQRIAIARALYKEPEVLIFDESTSSLDNTTEMNIIETINSLKENRIILIISHKENPLKNCDKIYKIESSKLKEIL